MSLVDTVSSEDSLRSSRNSVQALQILYPKHTVQHGSTTPAAKSHQRLSRTLAGGPNKHSSSPEKHSPVAARFARPQNESFALCPTDDACHGVHGVHGGHGSSHCAHGTRSRIRSDGAGPVGVVVKTTHRLGIERYVSERNSNSRRCIQALNSTTCVAASLWHPDLTACSSGTQDRKTISILRHTVSGSSRICRDSDRACSVGLDPGSSQIQPPKQGSLFRAFFPAETQQQHL